MNAQLERCLEDLEARLLPETEEPLLEEWRRFLNGKFAGEIFSPRRGRKLPAKVEWPKVHINDALDDTELMLLSQYGMCSRILENGGGMPAGVRPNYGTCIIPSLFGAELYVMGREYNTLPTNRPLGYRAIIAALEKGAPDLESGYFARVFETAESFKAVRASYPNVARYVMQIHPDFQGPMDVAELLWGSEIFLALYDEPETVHALLRLVTETYERAMTKWFGYFPADGLSNHNNLLLYEGNIMLRDDSAMNLSPEFYGEFIKPYDSRLLARFGGGAVHFCGRGDHYIESLCGIQGVKAVNMSQPQYNDLEKILRNTVDKGIFLLGFPADSPFPPERKLRGRVHVH